MITSPRLTPIRPDAAEYPVSALHLAQLHNRETFEEAHGVQPPPFDPAKPVKAWAITDCVGYEMFSVVSAGAVTIAPLKMTPDEAAAVNIPGSYRWDKYEPVRTSPATISAPDGSTTPVNGEILTLYAEAKALAAEITLDTGAIVRVQTAMDVPFSTFQWNGEQRRHWRIEVNGILCDAASLMRMRHENGVNRPGHWAIGGSVIRYIVASPATEPLPGQAEVPVPIAPLLPDEELYLHPFSGVMVRRRSAGTAPVSDNAVLAEILDRVKRLCEVMGV